jgi:sirohydrochlorin ferrochelatase
MNLICCAHGTRSPAGRRAIGALVAAVRAARPELHVRTAFVDVQPPAVAVVVQRACGGATAGGPTAGGRATVVVPLLLSSGFHVGVDIAAAVTDPGLGAVAAAALGPDPRLTALLLDRLAAAGLTADDAIVLAAAGSSQDQSVVDVEAIAAGLRAAHPGPVSVGYGASRAPKVPDAVKAARAAHPGRRVLIAAYLLAPGFFHDRLTQAGADAVTEPLLSGGIDPRLVELICDRYAAALDPTTTKR